MHPRQKLLCPQRCLVLPLHRQRIQVVPVLSHHLSRRIVTHKIRRPRVRRHSPRDEHAEHTRSQRSYSATSVKSAARSQPILTRDRRKVNLYRHTLSVLYRNPSATITETLGPKLFSRPGNPHTRSAAPQAEELPMPRFAPPTDSSGSARQQNTPTPRQHDTGSSATTSAEEELRNRTRKDVDSTERRRGSPYRTLRKPLSLDARQSSQPPAVRPTRRRTSPQTLAASANAPA